METSFIQTRGSVNQDLEIKPFFNVVIVYEDFAAGKHAQETYDFLINQLGREYIFTNQMWKFDILGNAKMREMAVKDAVAADLIIISTHGDALPSEVKTWIDRWTSEKGHAMALVNLIDHPNGSEMDCAILINYLEGVARKSHMDFFSQPDQWPDRDDGFSTHFSSDMAHRTSTIMANFIHHHTVAPRWGINE